MAEPRSAFHDCLMPGRYGPASDSGPALTLSESAVGGLVQLAGWGDDFVLHIQPALAGLGLAGIGDYETAGASDNAVSFRIAPQRLLVRCADAALLERTAAGLDNSVAAVVDLSHARAIIGIEGPGVEDLLARLATLDFRVNHFAPGRFAQTSVHHTGVLVHRLTATRFDIHVPSSFAVSLWDYVCICARPFGYEVVKQPA